MENGLCFMNVPSFVKVSFPSRYFFLVKLNMNVAQLSQSRKTDTNSSCIFQLYSSSVQNKPNNSISSITIFTSMSKYLEVMEEK